MNLKIPFWLIFALVFTIVIIVLVYIEILTASSLEFGTFGSIFTMVPAMILLELLGLAKVKWLIFPTTLILIFIIGSLLGFLIQKIKTKLTHKG